MQQTASADAASRDSDIADLLRAGHRDRAFAELVRRYDAKVYRLCHALLREHAQAQDAAQESLVRVWKSLESYDGRASLSSWIYAITRNRCLTALERRRTMESLSDEDVETQVGSLQAPDAQPTDDVGALLRELVDLLPERLRRTLLLYYFEERSLGEVALMLGCPEGTVKTQLFRARAALAEQLRRRGLDDPRHWLEAAS
ncbi:MAG TPA: sigma-70 family RNA polymerase sigma factor [Steroidobacteraceae bacterium]|nr:sigma-70 family RNA polymerase sigma factor [Steroidobacteraceae bacterium]